MSKTVIFYFSSHHGNTRKVVEEIKRQGEVELVELPLKKKISLDSYDRVGFASGVYMGKFHESLWEFIRKNKEGLKGKESFIVYTSGSKSSKTAEELKSYLEGIDSGVQGVLRLKGYDTYGVFKLFGGLHKRHPNEKDLQEAVKFYKQL